MTESQSLYFAGGQILGHRERQEDDYGAVLLDRAGGRTLLALADGMGGHAGGAEAAQAAVGAFLETARSDPSHTLDTALHAANNAIADVTRSDSALDGAGCTLIGAIVQDGTLAWVSVGDSPLLLLREGEIQRLNEDHSMRPVLAEMVEVGRLDRRDAENHPNRNALRSALMGDDIPLIDARSAFELQPGDQVILASDGLDVLGHKHIAKVLNRFAALPPQDAVGGLLAEIENAGAPRQDNATVVLYRNIASQAPRKSKMRGFGKRSATIALICLICGLAAFGAAWLAAGSGFARRFPQMRIFEFADDASPQTTGHSRATKASQKHSAERPTIYHAKKK